MNRLDTLIERPEGDSDEDSEEESRDSNKKDEFGKVLHRTPLNNDFFDWT